MMEEEHWPLHLKWKLLDFVNTNVHPVSGAGYDLAEIRHNNHASRMRQPFTADIAWPTAYEPDTAWSGFDDRFDSYAQEAEQENWISINDMPEREVWHDSWGAFYSPNQEDDTSDEDTDVSMQ